jgi:cyclopropane fatty-acyl-phospholipid synthase-like methyltransferase
MRPDYVHGYGEAESLRLHDQATTLERLVHEGTAFPPGSSVLEAGSGVGSQTIPLLRRNPGARITCVDIAAASLAEAASRGRRPELAEGFIRRTYVPMVAAVRDRAVEAGLTDPVAFSRGIDGLMRTAEPGGVFCYTFFKAVAAVPPRRHG